MGHTRIKTEYKATGSYGSTVKRTLYAHHNHICDTITFYDEDGDVIFSVEDTTEENTLMDAIIRLYKAENIKQSGNIEYMDKDDIEKCKL